jgi:hypothetical protein
VIWTLSGSILLEIKKRDWMARVVRFRHRPSFEMTLTTVG